MQSLAQLPGVEKMPKSIAIADSDPSFAKVLASFAQQAGFEVIEEFDAAESLWKAAEQTQFDVIVMDWKLRGSVSGLALFNRFRRSPNYAFTPILVVSGLVRKEDLRLLQEFCCTGLEEKPFVQTTFGDAIQKLWLEYQWLVRNTKRLETLMQSLRAQDHAILDLLTDLLNEQTNPIAMGVLVGRILLEQKKFAEAEKVFAQLLKHDPQNIICLNEMGKIHFLMGRHADALKVLKQADKLSPKNMERLCTIGQVELIEKNPAEARKTFEQALAIDQADLVARAGLTIADNVNDFFAQAHATISITRDFASLMNMIGIAKIRNGQFDEGLAHYMAAIHFIHDNVAFAKVMFNMGLAHLRRKDLQAAFEWFVKSLVKGGKEFDKSRDYVERFEKIFGKRDSIPLTAMTSKPQQEDSMLPVVQKTLAKESLTEDFDDGLDDDFTLQKKSA